MLLSCIYSFDIPYERSVNCHKPTNMKPWTQTEDDSGYELSHLEGRWERGKHRKYTAMLTVDQFVEFLNWAELVYDCDGSSIGTPGILGMTVAWTFDIQSCEDVHGGCNVTPLLDEYDMHMFGFDPDGDLDEEEWEILKERFFEYLKEAA